MKTATKNQETVTAEQVIERQTSHLETIEQGKPERLSPAMTENDFFAQGDLYMRPLKQLPEGYKAVEGPEQLVKGNSIGSRHCLSTLEGVKLWHPVNWSDESLIGPVFQASCDVDVVHPTHGNVTVPTGMMIQVGYQKNLDELEMRERRARD